MEPTVLGNSEVLVGHLVPRQTLKIQSRDPRVHISDHSLSLSNAGCTLHGSCCCIHCRTSSKHCPGASGRRSAAMEAAGAGAAEDSLRSAQDAQLDGWHGGSRDPGHGSQLLGLDRASGQFPSLSEVFPTKAHGICPSSSLEMYLTVITREGDWVSGL